MVTHNEGTGDRLTVAESQSLEQAARSLTVLYRKLRPSLKDQEKITLRFLRVQLAIQWILTNYRRFLPDEFVNRAYGQLTSQYFPSPFQESVPAKDAILRLRQLTRDVLGQIESVRRFRGSTEDF